MNTAILLIGGNLGDRTGNLQQAVHLIQETAGEVVKTSALYQTAPWGAVDQPDYLNQGLEIRTNMDALTLLHTLLEIERKIGRIRQQKWGSRVIDIDLIFFNDSVISLPELKVPHPRMQLRQFVLVPLLEIVPDYVHPGLHQTVRELAASCTDTLPASRYQP
ncbi:2-amino-4-hydroxy-6-hydroxymethyldihydropteridine diphosphokinase [Chitinophaga polysaccharea]|uniref:2-amino-4-hydroxy-6- hydroxymethyldihydropteridine diphosphokinase n=1 Tax=Chitinophaga TaxID=79328 RepID=UPI001455747A|nr:MULTISPECIES: 2-amino-4-hydroxy-6-hydroxymethyldihydropteridine diphosphokinase [Chitinophaga]NLR58747.1 2-amino-4-hydroxy-6-hydroxymethyldihydropteridine diphosphokinase [Chitinophaga polysaccharea]NLU91278.1 2-amino-4-hydroxy-6-hydroxymethyldihydropteridine diphosphokinase [Chitinophaga sp. Ak27]